MQEDGCFAGRATFPSFCTTARQVGPPPVQRRASRAGGANGNRTDRPRGGQRRMDRDTRTAARPSRQSACRFLVHSSGERCTATPSG